MDQVLVRPLLRFAVHEDGSLEVLSPWFPLVAFATDLLTQADGQRILVRDDEVTIRCANGGAIYALGPSNACGTRPGRLLRSWS